MCRTNQCCQKPEQLKNKPEECSPKQIKECHGDHKTHPCVPEKKAT
jgi:ArsR family transcriptional regulator